MDDIDTFALQNQFRKKLNEINRRNIHYYTNILYKYGGSDLCNVIHSFNIDSSRINVNTLGDYLQYYNALHYITDDLESNKNLIRLINSI